MEPAGHVLAEAIAGNSTEIEQLRRRLPRSRKRQGGPANEAQGSRIGKAPALGRRFFSEARKACREPSRGMRCAIAASRASIR